MAEVTFQEAYPMALRAAQVRCAAAVRLVGLQAEEREDIEQEVLTAVWLALPSYDPARASLRTYVEIVAESRFSTLLRSRFRRQPTEPLIDQHLSTLDGIPRVELQVDFERVENSLNDRDRRLAEILAECGPTEASHQLGIARSTVYERIHRLRDAFRAAGYDVAGGAR